MIRVKLIDQSVQILATNLTDDKLPFSYDEPEKLIERAGRLCYKTEERTTTDSWMKFLDARRKDGHKSIFEHAWEVRRMPLNENVTFSSPFLFFAPSILCIAGNRVAFEEEANTMVRHLPKVPTSVIANSEQARLHHPEIFAITAHFITNRGVTHEFVRHRFPMSFSQESTRYVRYKGDMQVIWPKYLDSDVIDNSAKDELDIITYDYRADMEKLQRLYIKYLVQYNMPAEVARDFLPNALKAEIIVTTHLPQWRHIYKQRSSPRAHYQFRELMELFRKKVEEFFPGFMEGEE